MFRKFIGLGIGNDCNNVNENSCNDALNALNESQTLLLNILKSVKHNEAILQRELSKIQTMRMALEESLCIEQQTNTQL